MRFKKTGISYLWLGLIFALFMIAIGFLSALVMVPFQMGLNIAGAPPVWLMILAIILGLFICNIEVKARSDTRQPEYLVKPLIRTKINSREPVRMIIVQYDIQNIAVRFYEVRYDEPTEG
jgi:hypothetical protein